MMLTEADKPKLKWDEFVAKMPPGRAPTVRDISDRWGQYEDVLSQKEPGKPQKVVSRRSLDNGEERAYLAWVGGLMEPEEQRYFSMLTLRTDALLALAVVPTIREVLDRERRIMSALNELNGRLNAANQRLNEIAAGGKVKVGGV